MVDSSWHVNISILQTMVSGIPLVLGVSTRMQDPYVPVVCLGPFLSKTG